MLKTAEHAVGAKNQGLRRGFGSLVRQAAIRSASHTKVWMKERAKMNTKRNMCLAAIGIATFVGVASAITPLRVAISQIQRYEKIDIKYLYQPESYEAMKTEKLNGQLMWEDGRKIQIKGGLILDLRSFIISIKPDLIVCEIDLNKTRRITSTNSQFNPRIPPNNTTNIPYIYTQITEDLTTNKCIRIYTDDLSKEDMTKLLHASVHCGNYSERVGSHDKTVKQSYIVIRGVLAGNYPYQIKDRNNNILNVRNRSNSPDPGVFDIKIEEFNSCLSKEEYERL